jgi:putative FmdB family regulatory protein
MPNYDYICIKCEYVEEINHSIHKSIDSLKCTKCGDDMKIKIGSNLPLVKFKGYGWPGEDIKKGARLKKSEYKKNHKDR